jgi:hypothetical protein
MCECVSALWCNFHFEYSLHQHTSPHPTPRLGEPSAQSNSADGGPVPEQSQASLHHEEEEEELGCDSGGALQV